MIRIFVNFLSYNIHFLFFFLRFLKFLKQIIVPPFKLSNCFLKLTWFNFSLMLLSSAILESSRILHFHLVKIRPLFLYRLNIHGELIDLMLALSDLIVRKLLNNLRTHSSSFRFTSTTHGTWFFNKLTNKSNNTMSLLAISNSCGCIYILADQGIF